MVTVGGGGPSFFGQHSHAQLLAQQEAVRIREIHPVAVFLCLTLT